MDPALLSLIGFCLTMYITPGPNNVMVASSAAQYGIPATLPHMFGIAVGFALMFDIVSAGLGSLLLAWPPLLHVLRWVGAAWMVWLAWKIASAAPPGRGERRRLMGFFGAAGFQWVNPKAWMIAVGAATTFLRPDQPLRVQLMRFTVIFLLCGMPCLFVWASLGSGLGRLLGSSRRLRAFNLTMAALLLASIVSVFIES
jgi:threonine/homoserine/homoserine lactone efflux protein